MQTSWSSEASWTLAIPIIVLVGSRIIRFWIRLARSTDNPDPGTQQVQKNKNESFMEQRRGEAILEGRLVDFWQQVARLCQWVGCSGTKDGPGDGDSRAQAASVLYTLGLL